MRKYADLKEPLPREDGDPVVRIMLCEAEEGTYLFEYDSADALQCCADLLYESAEEAYEEWNALITESGWTEIEDPLPGCQHDTFYGLTGLGDLIVTCQSKHSRNRRAGHLMGQGWTMDAATKEVGQVVEGIYSAKAGLALGRKYGVDIPIIEETNRVLFENKPATKALEDLMTRNRTMEYPGIVWMS